MRIDFPGVFIPVKLSAQDLWDVAGQLAQYTVKVMDSASFYLQNPSIAYAVLIGVNIAFFELAIQVCRAVNFLFNLMEAYDNAQENERCLRSLVLSTIFVSIIGVGNWAFYSGLRLPISKVNAVAVSILSCMAFFLYKSYTYKPVGIDKSDMLVEDNKSDMPVEDEG